MAPAAPTVTGAPAKAPSSAGLPRRDQMATFTLDLINDQKDPLNHPATVPAGREITMTGWIFDPVAKKAAKAADVVIDNVPYGATYGHSRADVADYFKNPDVTNIGVIFTVPAGMLKPGKHTVLMRAVSADGTAYYDAAPITFTVQ